MALSPQEAGLWTTEEKVKLIVWERQIDAGLRTAVSGGYPLSFATRGMTFRQREEIIRRYRAVGWQVTYTSEQREGDYLTFTPR